MSVGTSTTSLTKLVDLSQLYPYLEQLWGMAYSTDD